MTVNMSHRLRDISMRSPHQTALDATAPTGLYLTV